MKLRLKNIREAKGFTQREVAKALDVKLSTYRTWEHGSVKLTLENACIISKLLGCTPNDICGWYEEHPKTNDMLLTSEEREIVDNFRQCAPQWRTNISMTARAAAGESKEVAESSLPEIQKRKAM